MSYRKGAVDGRSPSEGDIDERSELDEERSDEGGGEAQGVALRGGGVELRWSGGEE